MIGDITIDEWVNTCIAYDTMPLVVGADRSWPLANGPARQNTRSAQSSYSIYGTVHSFKKDMKAPRHNWQYAWLVKGKVFYALWCSKSICKYFSTPSVWRSDATMPLLLRYLDSGWLDSSAFSFKWHNHLQYIHICSQIHQDIVFSILLSKLLYSDLENPTGSIFCYCIRWKMVYHFWWHAASLAGQVLIYH